MRRHSKGEKIHMTTHDIIEKTHKILDDKKAIDIQTICITEQSVLADYFILATGTSSTHIKALSTELETQLKEEGITVRNIEGYNSGSWILMDYGDFVVHIFTEQSRSFYNLDDLWKRVEQNSHTRGE